jgi:hypothetical protein
MQARSIRRGPSSSSLLSEPQGATQMTLTIELAGGDRVRISGAPDPGVVAAALRALGGR